MMADTRMLASHHSSCDYDCCIEARTEIAMRTAVMKDERVLWIEDAGELNEKDRTSALSAGFDVMQKRNLDLWANYLDHLSDFAAVVLIVTRANLKQSFANLKTINDFRMSSARQLPTVVIFPPPDLPKTVHKDFLKYGCAVLSHIARDEVFKVLRCIRDNQTAIDDEGPLVWLRPFAGHPMIFGPTGNYRELKPKGMERKIWEILCEHCGEIVFTDDIAEEAGCKREEVKEYIKRIRLRFAYCSGCIGLTSDPKEFIETLPGGYRLNAVLRR
jgi:hypothetical protein